MKCPFCGEEIKPVEAASASRVECRCPNCQSLVATYRKGMERRLNNLVSLERFKESAE